MSTGSAFKAQRARTRKKLNAQIKTVSILAFKVLKCRGMQHFITWNLIDQHAVLDFFPTKLLLSGVEVNQ